MRIAEVWIDLGGTFQMGDPRVEVSLADPVRPPEG